MFAVLSSMLCLCTTLSLFTDCKVFSLYANTSPSFPLPLGEQHPGMHEILIAISICILACMFSTQLI